MANKICKGTTQKTKGHGCGALLKYSEHNGLKTYYQRQGLGIECKCWNKWLMNTEDGQEEIIRVSRKAGMVSAQKLKKETKEKTDKMKSELMTANEYRSKKLQPVINSIARLIDYGCPCIATNNYGKENGGHFISVGANPTISLNLHNIHIQSFESNHFKSGDNIKYEIGIIDRYGKRYLEFMKSLQQTPEIKLTKTNLEAIRTIAMGIEKTLKKEQNLRTPIQRMKLRNDVNVWLGIYEQKFAVYEV